MKRGNGYFQILQPVLGSGKGEKVTDTQWHHVVAWNGNAKYAKSYLTKGTEVMVQGKLVNRSYEDKTGTTRYVTEVIVDQMLILDKKDRQEEKES